MKMKFKFRSRVWYCEEDLTDFFPVVPNPTTYARSFPDGEYTFRTSKKRERMVYYVYQNIWYIVEKSLIREDSAYEVAEFNLIPCKKESEWKILSRPEVYKCLSKKWATYVRAWAILKARRELLREWAN